MKRYLSILFAMILGNWSYSQNFNGTNMGLGNISRLSDAKTRSISPENLTGQRGKGAEDDPKIHNEDQNISNAWRAARDLGIGWKVNPYVHIKPGETFTLADIESSGIIQHIWMTPTGDWSREVLRFYWDGEKDPSVEVPVGAFFAMGWNKFSPLNSLAITVNPGSAFNSYWPMPFRKHCKITLENVSDQPMVLYYQVDYSETKVDKDQGYFHAEYNRSNPTQGSVYTIVDGIQGKGQYVGTYLALQPNNNGWWGEGEIKFYMDGDSKFPTIAGTGTEDYFCGSYDFENQDTHKYQEFSTAYAGLPQVIMPDGLYKSQQRFGMYRWHIMDPIRFNKDLKVTIQDLGWQSGGRYLAQHSQMISVAYWYQTEPHHKFRPLPSPDDLEIN